MTRHSSLLALGAGALLLFGGCGGGGNGGDGVDLSEKGEIEIDPAAQNVPVDIGLTAAGEEQTYTIKAINVGNGPLTIASVELFYSAPDAGDPRGEAFRVEHDDLPVVLEDDNGISSFSVDVIFTRQDTFDNRVASLRINNDSLSEEKRKLDVLFVAQSPQAVAIISPAVVDFGTVAQGDVKTRALSVASTGTDALVCNAFALSGHPDFTFVHPQADKAYPQSEATAQKVALEPPIIIDPSTAEDLEFNFTPQTDAAANGQFTLFCNDQQTEGHVAALVANENVPCINVNPAQVLFGGKLVGGKHVLPVTISNCGTAPLLISEIKLSDDSEPDFEDLDLKAPWTEPTPDVPLELPVNEALDVEITYVPPVVSPLDADNVPVPDVATLEVHNNSFEAVVEVPVSGTGIEVDCPKAVIIVEEGEEVVPQTTLHLKGDQSFSPFDGLLIKDYNWSVEQPDGSTSIFIPSATHDNPVFTVNVAGLYTFCLTVYDDANNESCEEACIDVIVIPDEAIHVELTWTTAADPDMTDEGEGKGSDLDLHFAHPFADGPDIDGDGEGDPWFHPVYDAFWFYKTNNWGTFSPDVDDDPHLDRDDIDGWGPENLNLKVQEQVVYDVGVHYWNDHCFGESLASVAIFLFGELVGEVKDVPLVNHDMWRVAEIDMTAPGNETVTFLTDDNGDHLITPNYINADFLPPLGSCTGNGDVEP